MDKIDQKLISLLLENARYPLKHLAQEVYLSPPAVSARLERLEEAGIITGYTARINPLKLGYHIKAYIHLELPPAQKAGFIRQMENCPNVMECDCVTGSYSMVIKGCFPSTAALDQFVGGLQKFGRTQTQIVFSTAVPAREVSAIPEDTP